MLATSGMKLVRSQCLAQETKPPFLRIPGRDLYERGLGKARASLRTRMQDEEGVGGWPVIQPG